MLNENFLVLLEAARDKVNQCSDLRKQGMVMMDIGNLQEAINLHEDCEQLLAEAKKLIEQSKKY